MSQPDLVVAIRAYPGLSKKPAFFTRKLDLWEASVRSLAGALDGVNASVHGLLDDCPDEYEEILRSHLGADIAQVRRLGKSGNQATWAMQLDLLSDLPEDQLVYLAEDDYLYVPGAFARSVDFQRAHRDVDFVSLFDHPGWYYGPDIQPIDHHALRWHGDRHWRTAVCTTCSFQSRARVLREARPALDAYGRGAYDMSMWMLLTRRFLCSPRFFLRTLREPEMGRIWRSAWKHSPTLAKVRRHSLWAPIRSLSTHLESVDLAPGIDWSKHAGSASS